MYVLHITGYTVTLGVGSFVKQFCVSLCNFKLLLTFAVVELKF